MSEISIKIPNNNVEERCYTINTLFGCVLRMDIPDTSVGESDCTEISSGGKKILIEDHFWNLHRKPLGYLAPSSLPQPLFAENGFCTEGDIPVIFGTDRLETTPDTIICGADIFASAFFMLTRWEEHCNPCRDEHGRFSAKDSIALKHGFLHRPVVNEYAETLWNMMKFLGFECKRQHTDFQPVLTHDVDILESNPRLKSAVGDILFRHDFGLAKSRFATREDPVDTFGFLMTQSERIGRKSTFFLMASDYRQGKTGNYLKTKRFARLIEEIAARGHKIGFHAGFGTSYGSATCKRELDDLRKATGRDISDSRQHFLEMQVPETLRILESCGITTDYTLGYHDHEGFRCGTGNEFPVFDFLNRKTLGIRELPLVIMDGTLKSSRNLSPEEALKTITGYLDLGRKYRMPITMLFHNSSFDDHLWKGWKNLYTNIIDNSSK